MGPAQPSTCPYCGHPIEEAPVDAGARGETGSAEQVCTACGRTLRLDDEAQEALPTSAPRRPDAG